jgi:uncharacterized protein (TIGR00730 family)
MSRIGVFCAASLGTRAIFAQVAADVGRLLAERRIGLVYGGGGIGLMGVLAEAALGAGGEVIGVIPQALAAKEQAHSGVTKLHVVATMHERKALMTKYADGFLALPGGYGTLDELFEAITWRQLRIHDKPVAVLDVDGYFAELAAFLERAVAEGFIRHGDRASLRIGTDANRLIDGLLANR